MSHAGRGRSKSPEHREKIRQALAGNLNALKTGRYSKRKRPAATCNYCPMMRTCPRYTAGAACVFVVEAINKSARKLGLPGLSA